MGVPQHPHQRPTRGAGAAVFLAVVVIGIILALLAMGTLAAGVWLYSVVPPSADGEAPATETLVVPVERSAPSVTQPTSTMEAEPPN